MSIVWKEDNDLYLAYENEVFVGLVSFHDHSELHAGQWVATFHTVCGGVWSVDQLPSLEEAKTALVEGRARGWTYKQWHQQWWEMLNE